MHKIATKMMNNKINEKLKVVIIGCGNIGYMYDKITKGFVSSHIKAFKSIPDVKVVAVCDTDKKKVKRCGDEYNVTNTYVSVKEMICRESPEIAVIAVSSDEHYSVFKEIIKCNSLKGILCEKPIAATLPQAKEMVKICKERGIILQVNFVRRFDPLYSFVKNNLKSLIGDVQKTTVYYSSGIANACSHLFDLARLYWGEPSWVQGKLEPFRSRQESNISGMFHFKSGIDLFFISCDSKYFPICEIDIVGTTGRIDLGRLDVLNKPLGDHILRVIPLKESAFFKDTFILSEEPKKINFNLMQRDYMSNSAKSIIYSIKNKKTPLCTGEDGISSLEMVLAAIYSAKHRGERVYFPFDEQKTKDLTINS